MRDLVELQGVFSMQLVSPAHTFFMLKVFQQWHLYRRVKTLMFSFAMHQSSHLQRDLIVYPMEMLHII